MDAEVTAGWHGVTVVGQKCKELQCLGKMLLSFAAKTFYSTLNTISQWVAPLCMHMV